MRTFTRILPFLVLAACGGSDPGTGTKTLYVTARAMSDGSAEGTSFSVEVRDGGSAGAIVDTAQVTMIGDKGTEHDVPWSGVRFGDFVAGANVLQGFTWEGSYRLKVVRGEDKVEAFLAGPGITTFTEPLSSTAFQRSSGPLTLKWKDSLGRHADNVRIYFNEADVDFTTEDDGTEQIEPNRLAVVDNERIVIERSNEVELLGGLPGSKFTATTSHRILDLAVE